MSKSKPTSTTPAHTPSAMQRRLRYGLNVTVAVVAAVGICVLLNWLVYRQYRGLSPDARQWVRYDLTSTRRYSLSPQTRSVLASLDDRHRVVTMLGGPDEDDTRVQEVRDLIDEYARASGLVESEHLDLARDVDRRSELLAEMASLYADDTRAVRDALAESLPESAALAESLGTIQADLQSVLDAGVVTNQRDQQALYDLNSQYLRLQEAYNTYARHRDEQLGDDAIDRLGDDGLVSDDSGEPLPDYVLLLAHLQQWHLAVRQQLLPLTDTTVQQVGGRVRSPQVASPEQRNRVLEARNTLAQIQQSIRQPHAGQPPLLEQSANALRRLLLRTDQMPQHYDDARAVLSDRPCVLVLSGDRARVIPSALFYRGIQGVETTDSDAQEQFLGEEQLTGALVSMSLAPPPRVIFVRSNTGRPALSIGTGETRTLGDYSHVAQRLRAVGIEVAEWAYDPHPSKAPERRAGQRVVWVVLPFLKPIPGQPQTMDQTLKASVVGYIRERLGAGDSAMLMLGPNTFADPQRRDDLLALPGINDAGLADDPLLGLLREWGIAAQVYTNAYRVAQEDAEGRPIAPAAFSFTVSRWPEGGALGQSLDGIATFFGQAYPIALSDTPGVTHTPLVELTDPTMWLQEPPGPQAVMGQPLDIDEARKRSRVLLGVAAERGAARLITVGDPLWATDGVTTQGIMPDGRTLPRLADQPGAYILYPGNSELFINSVYWLTGHDELIAASPRTQDIRRIPALETGQLRTYRTLLSAGVPAVIFLIGGGVWLIRRKA